MRKFIVVLLCLMFLVGCSKTDNVTFGENKALTASTPVAPESPTITSGTGTAAGSAIDDITDTPNEIEAPLPTRIGLVNDYAKIIDDKTKAKLEATLAQLKENSKIEFAIAIVDTTGEKPSGDYALALGRGWQVGLKEGSEGGILLLVAVKDRRWEIRWTRRLEDDLKDGTGAELKRQMTGPFREGKYGEGILKGVEAVISKLPGQHSPPAHN